MTERYVAGAVFQATAFDDKGTNFNVCLDSSRAFEHGSTAQIFLGRTDGAPPGTPPLVALKVFSQNVEEQELHKLQAQNRELKHAKEFRHANILPYCGTAVFDMHTILISPYVENGNLLKYLQANPTMDCRPLLLQVAQAVAFLHENKRIHGDIKCENVLISDEGKAMLADFGLSTFDSSTAHSRTFAQLRQRMTLQFAAPELVFVTRIQMPDGRETLETKGKSAETDVYAFAMTVIQVRVDASLCSVGVSEYRPSNGVLSGLATLPYRSRPS